jgi:hypothetical protein
MGALLALIPAKDWFYGAVVATLGVLGWHFYDKYQDAVHTAAALKAESVTALAAANKQIADLTTTYNANLKTLEDHADAQLQAAAAVHAADASSLRKLATDRGTSPVLQGASGTGAEAAAWASLLGRVELISSNLANALRNDDIAALECYAERDALTGK